jgi:hypothetical protein
MHAGNSEPWDKEGFRLLRCYTVHRRLGETMHRFHHVVTRISELGTSEVASNRSTLRRTIWKMLMKILLRFYCCALIVRGH